MNIGAVMGKVEAWSKTGEGKRRMKETIARYQKEGRRTTCAGGVVRTKDVMYEIAEKFTSILGIIAQDMDLPDSVLQHISNLDAGRITMLPDGGYSLPLFFSGDLHRDSLENDLGYDGIDNIVALFNNGYHAKNYVYGWWKGHETLVWSRREREALRFVQQAVAEFNARYGVAYGVTAAAGRAYE